MQLASVHTTALIRRFGTLSRQNVLVVSCNAQAVVAPFSEGCPVTVSLMLVAVVSAATAGRSCTLNGKAISTVGDTPDRRLQTAS